MKIYVRRAGIACLAFIVVAVVYMAVPAVPVSATTGVLDACVNGGNGMMRLVASNSACHADESFVEWNITGPQGPQGPQGPAGSSAGGPPFVWICTPANVDLGGNGDHDAEIDVVNGSTTTTANVAAHFLAKDGTNVGGQPIPGTGGTINYPGETGTTTVAVAPQTTRIYTYSLGSGTRDGNSALLASVIVTSDQPVVVGQTQGSGSFNAAPCGLMPK